MIARERRQVVLDHLTATYLGPRGGATEQIGDRPDLTYLVGTLFPDETDSQDEAMSADDVHIRSAQDDGSPTDDDEFEFVAQTANVWKPSSCALSILTDAPSLRIYTSYGTYARVEGERSTWRRTEASSEAVDVERGAREVRTRDDRAVIRIRERAWGNGRRLITIALCNALRSKSDAAEDAERSLYQARFRVEAVGGEILPYHRIEDLNPDEEREELSLRFRNKQVYAVGHGTAAEWDPARPCTWAATVPLPSFVVPKVLTRAGTSSALRLGRLAEIESDRAGVIEELSSFVSDYEIWTEEQRSMAAQLTGFQGAPGRIVERQVKAVARMREGIALLDRDDAVSRTNRRAFRLAMQAMRLQMEQSELQRRRDMGEQEQSVDPTWRPFQLAFILLCMASTADDGAADRHLVDLIWFPTGGGKTEAYLGLAAFEIFRRRLERGPDGAGTTVITRYTLRLLTIQQFQRTAALICAMEVMRRLDPEVRELGDFSIGLWIGNKTTPGTDKAAVDAFNRMLSQRDPENPFQLTECPWCGGKLFPKKKSDPSRYGAKNFAGRIVLRCPESCEFHDGLPVEVVDERIYDNPPTIVVATVDKFAQLPFVPEAGAILGARPGFAPPSLIIQDELHLLSGPLGTTVGIYEAAVLGIIEQMGGRPKVVASTATIRAAGEQVRGLMGRDVALFPPSGLDDDDSYFSTTGAPEDGRLYIGLMPQSFTQARSVVVALGGMLKAPDVLSEYDSDAADDYWTVVAYHNSLREHGRTVALVRDDVSSYLQLHSNGKDDGRRLRAGNPLELTGHVDASKLPESLRRMEQPCTSEDAVDVVASTNMLSVGIDVRRLASMLVVGQPKTTSEYIQATSRVGRGDVDGIVVTYYRANRPRDRSHYENFINYHQSLYRHVEPTSVTPWSGASQDRSLPGVLVALVRQLGDRWSGDEQAHLVDFQSGVVRNARRLITDAVRASDPREEEAVVQRLDELLTEWRVRAEESRSDGDAMAYQPEMGKSGKRALTRSFGDGGREGWVVLPSMRSVDSEVAMWIEGES